MSRKGFLVKVELDIQKITCPGVWLCSNGKVSLQIHMLDSSIQTTSCKPIFPITCYEKFVFHKTFFNDRRLNDLQRSLSINFVFYIYIKFVDNEWFYAELIQWQNCGEGCVLASFRTTLDDLLYPTSFRGSIAGMDIDLLMEPTKLFPGTLAPKLEVSTKTTVEETLCDLSLETSNSVVVKPKFLLSAQLPQRKSRPRQVCHSIAFSRAQRNVPNKEKKNKQLFQYRKANDDLILRNNPNVVLRNGDDETTAVKRYCQCYCNLRSRSMESIPSQTQLVYRKTSPTNMHRSFNVPCNCKKTHKDNCLVCSKYEGYFSSNNFKRKNCARNCLCTNNYKLPKPCPYCRESAKFHIRSKNNSPCESDISDDAYKKICFCLPAERTSGLAQQLHEKLIRTLNNNCRFLQNCTVCQNIG